MGLLRSISTLLARRWQLPVAVAAVIAAGLALSRVKPPERQVRFDALLADVTALLEGGRHYDAANAAANLLALQPPLTREQQGILHERLAEIAYRVESLREAPDRQNAKLLLQHQEDASARGVRPDVRFAERAAAAHEWLGATNDAIESHKLVLERRPADDVRRKTLQALVRLLDGRPGAQDQRRGYIEILLAEEGVSPAFVWWALQNAIRESLDREDFERARWLLERYADRFTRSDLKGYQDYLWAWLNVSEARYEEAEPRIDWVDEWLTSVHGVDAEMDKAGFLPAMNRWLRGKIELADARPQAALRCFDEVMTLQSQGSLFAEAATGRALALARLERHTAARKEIHDAVARLGRETNTLATSMPRIRKAMLTLSDERHELRDAANAVAYLALALDLTPAADALGRLDLLERLGRESQEAAELADEADARREFHATCGTYFEQAARLAALEPDRQANLLWASSQAYDRSGRTDDTRRMLAQFVEARSADPRLAPGLLQLGQACAADGRFEEACAWYQRLIQNFPQLEWALQARLLWAEALRMLGEERHGEVEAMLRALLDDSSLAPQSQTYRDALFELCDLLYQQGRFADAISGMEDFLRFYPLDTERPAVQFLLADAYRRSALALRDTAASSSSPAATHKESRARFQRAVELFDRFDAAKLAGDATRDLHQRLALFYRADCLFELNDPDTLHEALVLYRQAAALYQGTPAALTAQVQIANVLLRQGKATEAAQAVERARWLLRGVSDQAFADADHGLDRAHWDRYLATVASSQLFRDVFEGSR